MVKNNPVEFTRESSSPVGSSTDCANDDVWPTFVHLLLHVALFAPLGYWSGPPGGPYIVRRPTHAITVEEKDQFVWCGISLTPLMLNYGMIDVTYALVQCA